MRYQVGRLDSLKGDELVEFDNYDIATMHAQSVAQTHDESVGIWDTSLKGNQLVAIAYAGDLYVN